MAQYLLEINWAWDNSNTEFATITYEKYEEDEFSLENLLILPEAVKAEFSEKLKTLAHALDRSIMGTAKMVRLYKLRRSTSVYKCQNGFYVIESTLLKPICEFDENDNPIPLKA